ncbi:hypothetical protein ABZV14_44880 [Streptosporangium canum]|uniref:hypothetical protein n=1 Tax=Streptosporangium canum TaxID=324952 RepID=UPI0033B74A78
MDANQPSGLGAIPLLGHDRPPVRLPLDAADPKTVNPADAVPSDADTQMTPAARSYVGWTGESWGRPADLIVVRTPSRLSANSVCGSHGAAVMSGAGP